MKGRGKENKKQTQNGRICLIYETTINPFVKINIELSSDKSLCNYFFHFQVKVNIYFMIKSK